MGWLAHRGCGDDHQAPPALGDFYTLQEIEDEHIRLVLKQSSTFAEAAKTLGIEPSTLWRKRVKMDEREAGR